MDLQYKWEDWQPISDKDIQIEFLKHLINLISEVIKIEKDKKN